MIGPYMYVTTDSNANIKDYSDKYLFHQNLNKNKIRFSTQDDAQNLITAQGVGIIFM
jgi:hypothetical protein